MALSYLRRAQNQSLNQTAAAYRTCFGAIHAEMTDATGRQ